MAVLVEVLVEVRADVLEDVLRWDMAGAVGLKPPFWRQQGRQLGDAFGRVGDLFCAIGEQPDRAVLPDMSLTPFAG